jgi:hypothetical protein
MSYMRRVWTTTCHLPVGSSSRGCSAGMFAPTVLRKSPRVTQRPGKVKRPRARRRVSCEQRATVRAHVSSHAPPLTPRSRRRERGAGGGLHHDHSGHGGRTPFAQPPAGWTWIQIKCREHEPSPASPDRGPCPPQIGRDLSSSVEQGPPSRPGTPGEQFRELR